MVVRKFVIVRKSLVAIAVRGRLVSNVLEVNVLRVHRSCTVTPERQCSGVPVAAPGFERFVVLRTARFVASLARPATTTLAARAIAISV